MKSSKGDSARRDLIIAMLPDTEDKTVFEVAKKFNIPGILEFHRAHKQRVNNIITRTEPEANRIIQSLQKIESQEELILSRQTKERILRLEHQKIIKIRTNPDFIRLRKAWPMGLTWAIPVLLVGLFIVGLGSYAYMLGSLSAGIVFSLVGVMLCGISVSLPGFIRDTIANEVATELGYKNFDEIEKAYSEHTFRINKLTQEIADLKEKYLLQLNLLRQQESLETKISQVRRDWLAGIRQATWVALCKRDSQIPKAEIVWEDKEIDNGWRLELAESSDAHIN